MLIIAPGTVGIEGDKQLAGEREEYNMFTIVYKMEITKASIRLVMEMKYRIV